MRYYLWYKLTGKIRVVLCLHINELARLRLPYICKVFLLPWCIASQPYCSHHLKRNKISPLNLKPTLACGILFPYSQHNRNVGGFPRTLRTTNGSVYVLLWNSLLLHRIKISSFRQVFFRRFILNNVSLIKCYSFNFKSDSLTFC